MVLYDDTYIVNHNLKNLTVLLINLTEILTRCPGPKYNFALLKRWLLFIKDEVIGSYVVALSTFLEVLRSKDVFQGDFRLVEINMIIYKVL